MVLVYNIKICRICTTSVGHLEQLAKLTKKFPNQTHTSPFDNTEEHSNNLFKTSLSFITISLYLIGYVRDTNQLCCSMS